MKSPFRALFGRETPFRRPASVTLLALGVLSIASLNLLRLSLAVRQWSFLDAQPGVSPLYIALSGLIWTLVGFPLAWGLWRGLRGAAGWTRWLVWVYSVYYWLERLYLFGRPVEQSGLARWLPQLPENWFFALWGNLLLAGWIYWTLARSKAYFESYEREAHERN